MNARKKISDIQNIYLRLIFIALLIAASLAISWLSNQFTTPLVYDMMDEFYEINTFIRDFDQCEKAVYDYRWVESWEDEPAREEIVRVCLEKVEQDLTYITSRDFPADENRSQYARSLSNMVPHYVNYVNGLIALMDRGERSEAIAVYYEKENLVTLIRSYSSDLMLECVQASHEEYTLAQNLIRTFFVLQIFICSAALFLAILFGKRLADILNPISRLVEASDAMRRQEFDIPDIVSNTKSKELQQLISAFNHMKSSTRQLISTLVEHNHTLELLHQTEAKVLESQHLAEQAKLASLRSQINPHFLFNTLNTICRVARTEKAAQTESLIRSLASVFRHSLRSENAPATLAEEIYVTEQYFKIQKTRFGDRMELDWRISLPCSQETLLVPPFALQTMVENSIRHGLEPKPEGGKIRVRIFIENAILHLIVLDNGCGMSAETLEYIQRLERPPLSDHGIGLINVAKRLQVLGAGHRLKIQSKPNFGTKISIEIPVTYQEELPKC